MTAFARYLFVLAFPQKFTLFVVKPALTCIFPRPSQVAVGAELAQASKMWIIFFVTIYAMRSRISVLDPRFVTFRALDLWVSSLKWKIRDSVVKYFLVQ